MIRDAVDQDISSILRLAKEFWKHTMYTEDFEDEAAMVMLNISLDQGLVLVAESVDQVVGIIAAMETPLMASTKATQAIETMWYIDPDYRGSSIGVDLILQMEQKIKQRGVKYWNMASMESSMPQTIDKLYKRLGYTKSESMYTKIFN